MEISELIGNYYKIIKTNDGRIVGFRRDGDSLDQLCGTLLSNERGEIKGIIRFGTSEVDILDKFGVKIL